MGKLRQGNQGLSSGRIYCLALNEVHGEVPSFSLLKDNSLVFNTGSSYVAYDGACPNQTLTSCSDLTVSGINATCPCDNAIYNLFTGLSSGKQYPLKAYRVEVNGTNITVSN